MKKITLLFALIATFSINAQTITFFSDNFDDEDVSDWTRYDEDGDGNFWADIFVVTNTSGNPVTPISIISRSWSSDPLTPDNWIVSPAIDLSTAIDVVQLSWKVQAAAASWDMENYSVYASTSSDIADLEASSVMFTETYDDPQNTGPQLQRTLDLSSLKGETIYIAFRHHDCTDQDYLSIDDVMITDTLLSIENNQFEGFNYFVANNQLNLSANAPLEKISLHNTLGQEVLSQKLIGSNEVINLSGLQAGVYIATVSIDGASKSVKIVKN